MTKCNSNNYDFILAKEWLAGGLANAITSGLLNPMDVTKTKLQLLNKPISTWSMITQIYIENGLTGLWGPGLIASMTREMISSGSRAGLYVPVRNFLLTTVNEDSESFMVKSLSAIITGTIGSIISNPIDVVKIRLMVNPMLYPSLSQALVTVFKTEGFNGLTKGLFPSTLRGAFIAVGELATYDHVKYYLKKQFRFQDCFSTHILASLITGLVATTVAAPFDVIKSR